MQKPNRSFFRFETKINHGMDLNKNISIHKERNDEDLYSKY